MRIHRRLAATIVALVLLALGSIAPYRAIAASVGSTSTTITHGNAPNAAPLLVHDYPAL